MERKPAKRAEEFRTRLFVAGTLSPKNRRARGSPATERERESRGCRRNKSLDSCFRQSLMRTSAVACTSAILRSTISRVFGRRERSNLSRGSTRITGQNSAGKTALLEALTLRFGANPHRSPLTVPVPGTAPADASSARITFVLTRDELLAWLGRTNHWFPAPVPGFRIPSIGEAFDGTQGASVAFSTWLLDQPEFRVCVRLIRPVEQGETWIAEEAGLGISAAPVSGNTRAFVGIVSIRMGPSCVVVTRGPNRRTFPSGSPTSF